MGMRAQVHIKDNGVYLYTHWGSDSVIEDVGHALIKGRERWGDPEYLARIIFDEMKRDNPNEITGFGIGTNEVWGLELDPIEIDCKNREVTINGERASFAAFTGTENEQ